MNTYEIAFLDGSENMTIEADSCKPGTGNWLLLTVNRDTAVEEPWVDPDQPTRYSKRTVTKPMPYIICAVAMSAIKYYRPLNGAEGSVPVID